MKIYMMISQQIAPFSQVINDQLPIKENTSKKKFFSVYFHRTEIYEVNHVPISMVYCLLDFFMHYCAQVDNSVQCVWSIIYLFFLY